MTGKTRTYLVRLIILALLCMVPSLHAVEPIVRAELEPSTVSVGQAARLRITVLVPTWFPTPSVYPTFEQVNAVTRLPPNSSFPTNEQVDGSNWSGIVRDYQIYPQSASIYEFTQQIMVVTFADPDTQKPVTQEVPVPSFRLTGTVPKGAEELEPFLTSPSLKLEQRIDGETDSIAPGDALVRTVTATIIDMPAMFLPPLIDTSPIEGISIYPKDAVLDEKIDGRDDRLTSKRVESVTYVFESPGKPSLPGVELRWWNSDTNAIETTSIPPITISIDGEVGAKDQTGQRSSESVALQLLAVFAFFIAMALVVRRFSPGWMQWFERRQQKRRASEGYAFKQLLGDIRRGEKKRVYRSVVSWIDRFDDRAVPTESSTVAKGYGIDELAADLYGSEEKSLSMTPSEKRQIKSQVVSLRRRLIQQDTERHSPTLPTLNP